MPAIVYKSYLFFLFFFFSVFLVEAQKRVDFKKVEVVLKGKNNNEKITYLNNAFASIVYTDIDKATFYADKMLEIAQKTHRIKHLAIAYYAN